MIRICSWCGLNMGIKEPVEDRGVTHSCCPDCEEVLLKQDALEAASEANRKV